MLPFWSQMSSFSRGPKKNLFFFCHITYIVFVRWRLLKGTNTTITWRTEAPLWRNWRPLSAESIPPVAKMGNPGRARAMEVTALKAIGLIAVPTQNQNNQWLAHWSLEYTVLYYFYYYHVMTVSYRTNFKLLYLCLRCVHM